MEGRDEIVFPIIVLLDDQSVMTFTRHASLSDGYLEGYDVDEYVAWDAVGRRVTLKSTKDYGIRAGGTSKDSPDVQGLKRALVNALTLDGQVADDNDTLANLVIRADSSFNHGDRRGRTFMARVRAWLLRRSLHQ